MMANIKVDNGNVSQFSVQCLPVLLTDVSGNGRCDFSLNTPNFPVSATVSMGTFHLSYPSSRNGHFLIFPKAKTTPQRPVKCSRSAPRLSDIPAASVTAVQKVVDSFPPAAMLVVVRANAPAERRKSLLIR